MERVNRITSMKTAALLFLLTITTLAIFPIQTSDIFMYLALAQKIWQGGFAISDPFIFTTSNQPLPVAHEWLAYFVYYSIYQLAGWSGVIVANALAIASVFALILRWAKSQRLQSPILFFILTLVAIAAAPRFGVRSSWFTDLFTLIVIVVTLQKREHLKLWRIGLPILFLLWVNLHPGFPLGLVIIALRLFAHVIQRSPKSLVREWFLTLVFCTLATLINPLGIKGFTFPFEIALNWIPHFKFYIYEHRPTFSEAFLNQWSPWAFFALVVFTFVALMKTSRNRESIFSWFLFAFLVCVGAQAVRSVSLASYGLSAILIAVLAKQNTRDFAIAHLNKVFVAISAACLACITIYATYGYSVGGQLRNFGTGIDETIFPDKALVYIEQNKISGNLFNTIGMGSYLAWKWQGQRKIYIHNFVTDFEFFKNDYVDIVKSHENLDRIVQKYNLEGFLVTRQYGPTPLDDLLLQDANWRLAYSDSASNLYIKSR